MHFSIPDTTEVSAKSSSNQQAYTLFNIHLNGVHHCSLRYSQLRKFHEELQHLFPTVMESIGQFPPKKLFSLSLRETDERRILLEHYLQTIVQNKYVITSSYFNEFFFNAQIETFSNDMIDNENKVNLAICLLNRHEIIIENISINGNKSQLFDACIQKIQLQEDFSSLFSLYFYEQSDNNLKLFRPIYDFESPYLSLKQIKKSYENSCIVLKKSYWDSESDLKLIDDRRARNLLFIQAQYEIEQSQDLYSSDIYQQLEVLFENKSFKDYVLLARTSKFYGHIVIRDCSMLYPINDTTQQKLTKCVIAMGYNEIICCFNSNERKKDQELIIKVTRIRCWKVHETKQETNISLEYLIKKDDLQWITIHSDQASLISTLLQSIVDEILAKRVGTSSSTTGLSSAPQPSSLANEKASSKASNGLATRTESDLERLNNNDIFDRGGGDDDL